MPVLSGPLFSVAAAGTLAKTVTYSRWKGIKYARSRVIPANPQSAKQLQIRQVFKNLSAYWVWAAAAVQQPWNLFAKGKPFTNRNALVMKNADPLYVAALTSAFIASPGVPALPTKEVPGVAAGTTTLTITAASPTLPAGWVQNNWHIVVFPSVNPTTNPINFADANYVSAAAGALNDTVTGLTTGRLYDVFIWFDATFTATGEIGVNPSGEGSGTPT